MTIEEHIELHEQWLRSMESHHVQFVEDLERMKARQDAFEAAMAPYLTTITMNLAAIIESQARSDARHDQIHDQIEEEHLKLTREMVALRDLIERYIRFRGNGSEM